MGLYSGNLIKLLLVIAVATSLLSSNSCSVLRFKGSIDKGNPKTLTNYRSEAVIHSLGFNHPPYRHRMLHILRNERTTNSKLRYQLKSLVEFQAVPISVTTYPVAGKFGKFYPVKPIGSVVAVAKDSYDSWIPSKLNAATKSDELEGAYTPYIGMRAFTNIVTFVDILKDNFRSVHGPLKPST